MYIHSQTIIFKQTSYVFILRQHPTGIVRNESIKRRHIDYKTSVAFGVPLVVQILTYPCKNALLLRRFVVIHVIKYAT